MKTTVPSPTGTENGRYVQLRYRDRVRLLWNASVFWVLWHERGPCVLLDACCIRILFSEELVWNIVLPQVQNLHRGGFCSLSWKTLYLFRLGNINYCNIFWSFLSTIDYIICSNMALWYRTHRLKHNQSSCITVFEITLCKKSWKNKT